ncbi:MAG TPA: ABC transporter permease [Terriglobales bacterium]|nr:ABC transporter permease [Terriglobales bacterium]
MRLPWWKRHQARELEEELQSHLAMAARDRQERGAAAEAAKAEARREFGNLLLVSETTRDMWGWASLERFAQDLRYGARMLERSPGFAVVALLTLALGIGINTALFSVVNGVLLSPLPYPHPEQLVSVFESKPHFEKGSFSYLNFLDFQQQNRTLAAIAAYRKTGFTLTGSGQAEQLQAQMVSAGLFSVLGIRPVAGRLFTPEEDRLGTAPAVILSTELWTRKFGGAPEVIGKSITLDGSSYIVVGVVPGELQLYIQNFRKNNDVYVLMGQFADPHFRDRNASWGTDAIARLKPGVTVEQARADLNSVARGLGTAYPGVNKGIGVTMLPLKEEMVGDVRPLLLVLLGAVGFVLLIACGNVANLLLARATVRQREFAIRSALGASPLRVIRQLLTETLLLAVIAGTAGLVLAAWGTQAALRLLPASIPRASHVGLDLRVLGFTLAITALSAVVFGLAPAIKTARPDLHEELKEGGRGGSGARHRAQAAFVIMEMALALVLLAGAGLMIRTLAELWRINPGFEARNVVLLGVGLPPGMAHASPDAIRSSLRQAEQAIASTPGIESAALSEGAIPLRGDNEDEFWLEGQPKPASVNDMAWSLLYVVQPAYFQVMKVPLLRGRLLTAEDNEHATPVALVDEDLAHRYFPHTDPLGKHIHFNSLGKTVEIVGVVGHVKQFGLDTDARNLQDQTYLPMMQTPDDQLAGTAEVDLLVRTTLPPLTAEDAMRGSLQHMNRDYVIFGGESMNDVIGKGLAARRFSVILLVLFASLALLLAAIGIYGVVSYVVVQRQREIGIRMALGARRGQVFQLMLRQGARMALAGLGIGVAAAFGLTRLMTSLLYGVKPTDALTFAVAACLLCAIALAACCIPARRATRVDPMLALRCE